MQEVSLSDVADHQDTIGVQFVATIGLDGCPKVRPMQYMVLEDKAEFAKPVHFRF